MICARCRQPIKSLDPTAPERPLYRLGEHGFCGSACCAAWFESVRGRR